MASTPTGQVVRVDEAGNGDEYSALEIPRMLVTIWDDDMLERSTDETGKKKWVCKWCDVSFQHWNATKALHHVSKNVGANIKKCSCKNIDAEHSKRYKDLFDSMVNKKKCSLLVANERDQVLEEHLKEAGASLRNSMSRAPKRAKSLESTAGTAASSERTFHQPKIVSDAVDPQQESQLTMAITDLIHSCGLSFTLVSNHKFKKVLSLPEIHRRNICPP